MAYMDMVNGRIQMENEKQGNNSKSVSAKITSTHTHKYIGKYAPVILLWFVLLMALLCFHVKKRKNTQTTAMSIRIDEPM